MDSVSYETPTQGEIREMKLRCRLNTTVLSRFPNSATTAISCGSSNTAVFGREEKANENVRFALVTRVSIPRLSVVFKCPHVLRVPKHLHNNILPYHCVDSSKNALPGNPDASKLHLCIQSPTNGNRRFPRSRQQEGHEG